MKQGVCLFVRRGAKFGYYGPKGAAMALREFLVKMAYLESFKLQVSNNIVKGAKIAK
jgi:hypothetical protein